MTSQGSGRQAGLTQRALKLLASLKLTIILLSLLLVELLLSASEVATQTMPRVVLVGLLGVNLAANIAHRRMWRRPPMAAFHLTLLGLLGLVIWGRLTFLSTQLTLLEGVSAKVAEQEIRRGPFAPEELLQLSLLVEEFETRYWRGPHRQSSRVRIRAVVGERTIYRGDILPNEPATVLGADLYSRGAHSFSAVFALQSGPKGAVRRGYVHFPEYYLAPAEQVQELNVPGQEQLTVRLQLPALLRADGPWELRVPARVSVELTGGSLPGAVTLAPGSAVALGSGLLRLEEVRRNGVVVVSYDPSAPWILVLSLLAPVALLWHYLPRWRSQREKSSRGSA